MILHVSSLIEERKGSLRFWSILKIYILDYLICTALKTIECTKCDWIISHEKTKPSKVILTEVTWDLKLYISCRLLLSIT